MRRRWTHAWMNRWGLMVAVLVVLAMSSSAILWLRLQSAELDLPDLVELDTDPYPLRKMVPEVKTAVDAMARGARALPPYRALTRLGDDDDMVLETDREWLGVMRDSKIIGARWLDRGFSPKYVALLESGHQVVLKPALEEELLEQRIYLQTIDFYRYIEISRTLGQSREREISLNHTQAMIDR